MSNPTITITGRVGKVYPVEFGNTGTARLNLSIATSKSVKDKTTGTWSDGPTSWWRITCWGQLAENVDAAQLAPGDQVIIVGEICERAYTDKDGQDRRVVDITARHIGPDLDKTQAVVKRITREPANPTGGPW